MAHLPPACLTWRGRAQEPAGGRAAPNRRILRRPALSDYADSEKVRSCLQDLQELRRAHPDYSYKSLARALERKLSWRLSSAAVRAVRAICAKYPSPDDQQQLSLEDLLVAERAERVWLRLDAAGSMEQKVRDLSELFGAYRSSAGRPGLSLSLRLEDRHVEAALAELSPNGARASARRCLRRESRPSWSTGTGSRRPRASLPRCGIEPLSSSAGSASGLPSSRRPASAASQKRRVGVNPARLSAKMAPRRLRVSESYVPVSQDGFGFQNPTRLPAGQDGTPPASECKV